MPGIPKFQRISHGGLGHDYSSLTAWQAGIQGDSSCLHVALLDDALLDEYRNFVKQGEFEYLFADAIFATNSGKLLGAYIDGRWNESPRDNSVADFVRDLSNERDPVYKTARTILRTAAKLLARLIAESPDQIDEIEWRDLERVLAEVFEAIGFQVTLTPPSKDGGKDLILHCIVSNAAHSYAVEVKHWRSGQKVGGSAMKKFIRVIVSEGHRAGLILATYGVMRRSIEAIVEEERHLIRVGEKEKIVSLCRLYQQAQGGHVFSSELLPNLLFRDTY
jgi:hypothetical protein